MKIQFFFVSQYCDGGRAWIILFESLGRTEDIAI